MKRALKLIAFVCLTGMLMAVAYVKGSTIFVTQSSGADAIQMTTNGSRMHYGAGASDYASSDGTTVTFAGPVSTGVLTSSGNVTAGNTFRCSSTAGTCLFVSNTNDATVTPTIASAAIFPAVIYTSGDRIFAVLQSDGTTLAGFFQASNPAAMLTPSLGVGSNMTLSGTAPTISSGFGSGPSVTGGTSASFRINVGTGGAATTGVIGMPTAATGWNCSVADVTTPDSFNTVQTASTVNTVSVKNYSRTLGTAIAWTASDVLGLSCLAF